MWKKTWDPEGLVSTIPAIATTLSGVLTGHFLRSSRDKKDICGWLFTAGWLAIVVGLFWHIAFPINKSLWTSSYVVFTSGCALQFLGFCYWLIDVKEIKTWAKPAVIFWYEFPGCLRVLRPFGQNHVENENRRQFRITNFAVFMDLQESFRHLGGFNKWLSCLRSDECVILVCHHVAAISKTNFYKNLMSVPTPGAQSARGKCFIKYDLR